MDLVGKLVLEENTGPGDTVLEGSWPLGGEVVADRLKGILLAPRSKLLCGLIERSFQRVFYVQKYAQRANKTLPYFPFSRIPFGFFVSHFTLTFTRMHLIVSDNFVSKC